MRKRYLLPISLLVLSGCVRENLEPVGEAQSDNKIHVTLRADMPATKVTFDGEGQLAWEDADSVSLIIGNSDSRYDRDGGNNSLAAKLTAVEPGVFEGIVDLGSFTRDEIQAAVYPHNAAHHYRRSNDGDGQTFNVGMMVGGKKDTYGNFLQVQKEDNVLNGENITLFSCFDVDYSKDHPNSQFKYGGEYLFDDKTFQWGSALIRFNIYGKQADMGDDEVFESLELNAKTEKLAGIQYYIKGHDVTDVSKPSRAGQFTIGAGNTAENHISVSLENGVTIADKTKDNGVKVFMSLLPRGTVTFPEEAYVQVNTDQMFYYIPLSGVTVDLERGQVRKVSLDMSTARRPDDLLYSINGGEKVSSLPADMTDATSLKVFGGVRFVNLEQIRDFVKMQTGKLDLDMTEAEYESSEFPALFAGTSSLPDMILKSVKFPGNVLKIAANAFSYCKALEEVDLSTVSIIGGSAFRYTGLKTLDLPSNITQIGNYAFGDLEYLASVNYNPSIDWASISSEKGNYSRHIPNRKNTSSWNTRNNPTTITVGPNVKELPEYCFDTNAKLTELIIEADNLKFISQWAIRAYNIERIVFKGGVPDPASEGPGGDFANRLNDYEGVIICPEGKLAEFADNAAIQTLLATKKYMLREEGMVAPKVKYSVDGGATWNDMIPSQFETLGVKTEDDNELTISELYAIAGAAADQSAAVTIDLSAAKYMSDTFPGVFAGTESAHDNTLKSIKFPSNVTKLADGAFIYCDALESVDLTGITEIGTRAFQYSGLKTVNVPSSVTASGTESFSYLKYATDIYWNASIPSYNNSSSQPGGNTYYKYLCNRSTDWSNSDWNNENYPETVTIGPDVKALPPYFFDTNARLTNLIIEADDLIFHDQWAIRAFNIKRIEFKSGVPNVKHTGPGNQFASNLDNAEGLIICPDECYDEFASNALIQALISTGKYVLIEKSWESGGTQSAIYYSADGDNWGETIPADFTTLHVRTTGPEGISADQFTAVAAAINAKTSPVGLDLSRARYASTTFPVIFAGTATAPNTVLKSIKLPSNVSTIPANAFECCSALESVDLSNVSAIGDYAFRNTGLKSIRVDKQVTSLGVDAFYNCFNLAEAYFNSTDPKFAEFNTSTRVDCYTFAWDKANADDHNTDLVMTVGPDTQLPRYAFINNGNLTKVVFEYNGAEDFRMGNNAICNNHYLNTVELKGTEGILYFSGSGWGELSTKVPAGTAKQMIVPKGCSSKYSATEGRIELYTQLVTNNGFTLVEAD